VAIASSQRPRDTTLLSEISQAEIKHRSQSNLIGVHEGTHPNDINGLSVSCNGYLVAHDADRVSLSVEHKRILVTFLDLPCSLYKFGSVICP
jgi:hypothetical protein